MKQFLVERNGCVEKTLINGKIIMSGEGFEQVVDYGFTNKEALSGTDLWTDYTNSDPIAYLKEKRLQIIQKQECHLILLF